MNTRFKWCTCSIVRVRVEHLEMRVRRVAMVSLVKLELVEPLVSLEQLVVLEQLDPKDNEESQYVL